MLLFHLCLVPVGRYGESMNLRVFYLFFNLKLWYGLFNLKMAPKKSLSIKNLKEI